MAAWPAQRLGAIAGVAFVVLALIATFVAGSVPKFNDSPAKIASFYQAHHSRTLLATVLSAAAAAFFVWLVASIAVALREVGQGAWAAIAFGGGMAGIALAAAGDALAQVDAHVAREGDTRLVQGLYQTSGFLTTKAFWFAALVGLAVGLGALRGAVAGWYAWTSLGAALLLALGGVSVKQGGFFSAGGGMVFIAFLALLVWALATSVVVWMSAAAEERPAPVTAPI
jgi:hypothetical protein